ncbi:exported hypothetical protein [Microbacterium sp. 8M]|nr:exported hypothetical protein [Microbacterium sp. 8M]
MGPRRRRRRSRRVRARPVRRGDAHDARGGDRHGRRGDPLPAHALRAPRVPLTPLPTLRRSALLPVAVHAGLTKNARCRRTPGASVRGTVGGCAPATVGGLRTR